MGSTGYVESCPQSLVDDLSSLSSGCAELIEVNRKADANETSGELGAALLGTLVRVLSLGYHK